MHTRVLPEKIFSVGKDVSMGHHFVCHGPEISGSGTR